MSGVTIIDSGVANLASVRAAFSRLGVDAVVAGDAGAVRNATCLVLPGVGAFGAGMAVLRARGLDESIREAVTERKPLLAICLGLQLLTESSEESPGVAGLGIIRGLCRRLPDECRVPHLGWNVVVPGASCRAVPLMEAAFANSYALGTAPAGWSSAWTVHGRSFVAAVERERTVACQFHPELSGAAGAALLERWLTGTSRPVPAICARTHGLAVRIVPCLDVCDGRVVKGIQFQDLRDTGDPAALASRYESEGADEVVLLDIAASPQSRPTQVETVRRVRSVLGIPLTVGGGVRTVDDARQLLAAGADKVSVNTAAVARPALLAELAAEFGRQCVVAAIDARRSEQAWDVLVLGGREAVAGMDAVTWARQAADAGAGEILLTSWDRDGTRSGCDLALLRAVREAVRVPVIASGGIGTRGDVADAITAGADAVLAASVFHDSDDTVAGVKSDLAVRGFAVRR